MKRTYKAETNIPHYLIFKILKKMRNSAVRKGSDGDGPSGTEI